MSARGTGRALEPLPEDALPDMRPFTDPAGWAPWGHRKVPIAVKVALEAHAVLVKYLGHSGAFHCPCPLARAACTAWDGAA